ncbi:radical SAM protein [Tsuneonella sp. SYSU-LHT278]|uniref:radical SAM protein n=1 Tax=Tsuneonella sediminis TaxID=3416089 RepID=UPI003F7AE71E
MSLAGAPNTVFWEVTNRCNLSCETCYNSRFLNNKAHTLTVEQGEERCRDIMRNGVTNVIFLGGEPLADRNLFHYLEVLRAGGVQCSISTNGTLVTPVIAERLASLQLKLVAVSLDGGTAATNDRIRGGGTFDRIFRGIQNLANVRGENRFRLAVALTLAEQNCHDFESFFLKMAELDIADIFVNKYVEIEKTSLGVPSAAAFLGVLDDLCRTASRIGNFYLYLPTMPRVADYLAERHRIYVSAKEQSCGAVDEALLLADDGCLYPCSMARAERSEFKKAYTPNWSAELPDIMGDFVEERLRMRSHVPEVCGGCRYEASCAKMCVLSREQSKYHEACEALCELLATDRQTRAAKAALVS